MERSNPSIMSGRYCGFRLAMVSSCQQTFQCQCLPRAFETVPMCPPRSRGCILTVNNLSTDLAPVHTARTTQQLFAEFRAPADWLQYLPDLNLLDFATCSVFQAKVLAMLQAFLDNLHPPIVIEWDRLAAEYIYRTFCSFWGVLLVHHR